MVLDDGVTSKKSLHPWCKQGLHGVTVSGIYCLYLGCKQSKLNERFIKIKWFFSFGWKIWLMLIWNILLMLGEPIGKTLKNNN